MKVILRENVKNLGMAGDIVEVKTGYARNFLLPQGMAEIATAGAVKNWQLGAERRAKKIEAELKEARAIAEKLWFAHFPYTRCCGFIFSRRFFLIQT